MTIVIDVTYLISGFTLISAGYCATAKTFGVGYHVINRGVIKLIITG